MANPLVKPNFFSTVLGRLNQTSDLATYASAPLGSLATGAPARALGYKRSYIDMGLNVSAVPRTHCGRNSEKPHPRRLPKPPSPSTTHPLFLRIRARRDTYCLSLPPPDHAGRRTRRLQPAWAIMRSRSMGILRIMAARQDVARLVADPGTPAELKARMESASAIRQFASDALDLPDNASYRSYVDIGRDYVTVAVYCGAGILAGAGGENASRCSAACPTRRFSRWTTQGRRRQHFRLRGSTSMSRG